jgi:hypothetical protein
VPTAKATMADDFLDTKICHIRNVQISNEDLECLLPHQKLKLPSSTINAYGAWVQKKGEDSSEVRSACAIFSSWLGPLVTGKVKEGKIYGTFEGHVLVAVSIRHTHLYHYTH